MLSNDRWRIEIHAVVVLLPGGFLAGVLIPPLAYFVTYGDIWKTVTTAILSMATLCFVVAGILAGADYFKAGQLRSVKRWLRARQSSVTLDLLKKVLGEKPSRVERVDGFDRYADR